MKETNHDPKPPTPTEKPQLTKCPKTPKTNEIHHNPGEQFKPKINATMYVSWGGVVDGFRPMNKCWEIMPDFFEGQILRFSPHNITSVKLSTVEGSGPGRGPAASTRDRNTESSLASSDWGLSYSSTRPSPGGRGKPCLVCDKRTPP